MKKMSLALAAVLGLSSLQALAADPPKSDWTVTGNAGLFSDYRFRGISQTNKKPAFQGGFDVSHASGFYAGNWNSNIDSGFYSGSNLEMDFYGGYKMPIGDLTLDFGALYYYYPGSGDTFGVKVNNKELYVGAAYGPASLKVSYPLSDFFSAEKLFPGTGDAAGSYYVDGSASFDLGGGLVAVGHVGYQKLKGAAQLTEIGGGVIGSVIDYKLGVTYDLSGFIVGAALVGTNRDLSGSVAGRNISNDTLVLSLSKSF